MVLTKSELIASLQNEVRILLHLGQQDRSREARLPPDAEAAQHDRAAEVPERHGARRWCEPPRPARSTRPPGRPPSRPPRRGISTRRVAAIAAHADAYATLLGDMSDADFRAEIEMFGSKTSRGAFIVNLVLCGCAAYRTQLFLYLKACGREELGTMNLWAGVDAPAKA